jgi:hypothetical protein
MDSGPAYKFSDDDMSAILTQATKPDASDAALIVAKENIGHCVRA